jgi:cyclase
MVFDPAVRGRTGSICFPVPRARVSPLLTCALAHAQQINFGDFYRNYGYPFVEPAHGGSVAGVVQALDRLMELAGPDTRLVPGHGTVISRAEPGPYRDMIVSIQKTAHR